MAHSSPQEWAPTLKEIDRLIRLVTVLQRDYDQVNAEYRTQYVILEKIRTKVTPLPEYYESPDYKRLHDEFSILHQLEWSIKFTKEELDHGNLNEYNRRFKELIQKLNEVAQKTSSDNIKKTVDEAIALLSSRKNQAA